MLLWWESCSLPHGVKLDAFKNVRFMTGLQVTANWWGRSKAGVRDWCKNRNQLETAPKGAWFDPRLKGYRKELFVCLLCRLKRSFYRKSEHIAGGLIKRQLALCLLYICLPQSWWISRCPSAVSHSSTQQVIIEYSLWQGLGGLGPPSD